MPRLIRKVAIFLCSLTILVSASDGVFGGTWNEIKVGFLGQGKPGRWLPISASAQDLPVGKHVELKVALPDPRGDVCVETVAAGTVDSSGAVSFSGYCRSGRLEGFGVVSVVSDGETLCRSSLAFGEDLVSDSDAAVQKTLSLRKLNAITLLTIGDVTGMEEFVRNVALQSTGRSILQHVVLPSVSQLPDRVVGLDCVEMLLLTDDFATTTDQAEALKSWVRDGGHLFVSTGGSVAKLLESPIGAWLTDHFEIGETPTEMRRFTTLESFVPGASRIQTSLQGRETWPVVRLNSEQTVAIVDSLDGPIIGRQSVGGGVVTIVGLDVNELPLSRWASLPEFYEILFFSEKLSKQGSAKSRTSRISQSGVSDLATQILVNVDASPETGQWSTWSVMAMLVCWLLLIGPVDYVIVNRLLRKPHMTWLTFPLLIVAGTAAIVACTGNATDLQVRQLRIVDVVQDGDHTFISGLGWGSVSAPDTRKIDCTAAAPQIAEHEGVKSLDLSLSWGGRPEDVFGAMYRKGGIGLGQQSFMREFDAPEKMSGVPLLSSGSRAFEFTWHDSRDTPLFESKLIVSGFGLLNGTFSHQLPGSIRDWILVHGNRAYQAESGKLQELHPNAIWDAKAPEIRALDLKAYLTAAKLVESTQPLTNTAARNSSSMVSTPYDSKSTDMLYVMSMINFYNTVGGAEYVGLSQTQLRRKEVSDTIRLNHAVLLGFVDVPESALQIDGAEAVIDAGTQTMIRLFLPVDTRPSAEMAKRKEDIDKAQQTGTTDEN